MRWDLNHYHQHADYVSRLGEDLLRSLDPRPAEHILDIGGGDGALAEKIMRSGATVHCVDSSPEMVEAAKKRGIAASVVDAHELPFVAEFDAVFSNAALHWMKRPDEVIRGVFRALKPQGRFVAELGARGNVQTLVTALRRVMKRRGLDYEARNPWYFPAANEYKQKLEHAGFVVAEITAFDRPTKLPTDARGWLRTFALPFLADVAEQEHDVFLEEVAALTKDALQADDGAWYADYVRCRFVALRLS